MSRTIVVRRLTAALAVVAVLFLALPAGAATHRPHAVKAPEISAPSLLDQLLLWLGIPGFGQGSVAHTRPGVSKAASTSPPLGSGSGLSTQNSSATDATQGMDPNGFH